MKKISILIPCLNEIDNIYLITAEVERIMKTQLSEYNYEIVFIDNYSTDGTREALYQICKSNKKVKAILNARNFGPSRSPVYGMMQTSGDCTIQMAADFQDPPSCIPELVRKWEMGSKIVVAKKSKSRENIIMFFIRKVFYKIFKLIGEIDHIEQFTGFGLYDKSFIEVLKAINDPCPYLRGIVAELGSGIDYIEYVQPKRERGKTKTNFFSLYDVAMQGFTSYSKIIPRFATLIGFGIGSISVLFSLYYFIMKLIFWQDFALGIAPVLISLFFLNGVLLFFIGFLSEYVLSINTRVMNRPLVIEEKRFNFDNDVEAEIGGMKYGRIS